VAKPRNSPYQFTETETYWVKVKNREYSQQFGRDDLFAFGGRKLAQPDGGSCMVACGEAEL
jgi:ATP-dependent DNA ligase